MSSPPDAGGPPASAPRVVFGGFLMGLANLVPGISGGTMILAVGLYERFIDAIANVTRLRLSRASLLFIVLITIGAGVAILGFSGLTVALVRDHRWVMYSLFVGMTLGGVPLLWRFLRPFGPGVVIGFAAGFGLMLAQFLELFTTRLPDTTPWLVLAGALGATSMVLPGISGAYVLLILGLYETVIGSVSVSALRADLSGSLAVLVPVGIGAAVGIGGLSNLLKWLLARFSAPVHGALMGLLIGSVLNLYPFQDPLHPELADRAQRKAITALVQGDELDAIEAAHGVRFDAAEADRLLALFGDLGPGEIKVLSDAAEPYLPELGRGAIAVALLLAGFGVTFLLGRSGNSRGQTEPESPPAA